MLIYIWYTELQTFDLNPIWDPKVWACWHFKEYNAFLKTELFTSIFFLVSLPQLQSSFPFVCSFHNCLCIKIFFVNLWRSKWKALCSSIIRVFFILYLRYSKITKNHGYRFVESFLIQTFFNSCVGSKIVIQYSYIMVTRLVFRTAIFSFLLG